MDNKKRRNRQRQHPEKPNLLWCPSCCTYKDYRLFGASKNAKFGVASSCKECASKSYSHSYTDAVCETCKKTYKARTDGKRKYCSSKCCHEGQSKSIQRYCYLCKKPILVKHYKAIKGERFFCSKECCDLYKTGKSNINLGSFVKGSIAWNKGTKGVMKPNSGSFQKGRVLPLEHRGLGGKGHLGKVYVPIEIQHAKKILSNRRNTQKLVDNIHDSYVIGQLKRVRKITLPNADLIKLVRERIRMKRTLKELKIIIEKGENHESDCRDVCKEQRKDEGHYGAEA
jgi:hypothetical protein